MQPSGSAAARPDDSMHAPVHARGRHFGHPGTPDSALTMRVPLNHGEKDGPWLLTRLQIGRFLGAVYARVYAVHATLLTSQRAPASSSERRRRAALLAEVQRLEQFLA